MKPPCLLCSGSADLCSTCSRLCIRGEGRVPLCSLISTAAEVQRVVTPTHTTFWLRYLHLAKSTFIQVYEITMSAYNMQHSTFKAGHTCTSNVPVKMLADSRMTCSKDRCTKTHHITSHHITAQHITVHCITSHHVTAHHVACSIAQVGNQQSDGYLSGSSFKRVPLLVFRNVWIVNIRVIWFVTMIFSSLCFGFTPSYDLSYAGIAHLEGLQQISDLIPADQ